MLLSRYSRLFLSAAATGLVATGGAATDPAGAPADVITAFHATLLDNMKHGKQYGCDGRAQRLSTAVDATYDIPFIAERALRRDWSQLTPDQRTQFVAAYKDMVTTTYATEFRSFDGDSFNTLDSKDLPNGFEVVHARLKPGHGDAHTFDYVLHPAAGGWRVANVISDGVSTLSLQSEQYASVFEQKGGFEGLMTWLQGQTRDKRNECSAKSAG
jgi:phospholipid transport system substrate-binding protein